MVVESQLDASSCVFFTLSTFSGRQWATKLVLVDTKWLLVSSDYQRTCWNVRLVNFWPEFAVVVVALSQSNMRPTESSASSMLSNSKNELSRSIMHLEGFVVLAFIFNSQIINQLRCTSRKFKIFPNDSSKRVQLATNYEQPSRFQFLLLWPIPWTLWTRPSLEER